MDGSHRRKSESSDNQRKTEIRRNDDKDNGARSGGSGGRRWRGVGGERSDSGQKKKKMKTEKRRREDQEGDKDLLVSSHWRPEATCHPGSLRPGRLWQNLWENTNPPPHTLTVHPPREGRQEEEEEETKNKRVKNRIIKDLVGFAMHRDRLADKWQPVGEGGWKSGGWGVRVMSLGCVGKGLWEIFCVWK